METERLKVVVGYIPPEDFSSIPDVEQIWRFVFLLLK